MEATPSAGRIPEPPGEATAGQPPTSPPGPSNSANPANPTGPRRVGLSPTLRDRIVEHLKRSGADSISGIARVLSEDREAPVHRLTVAGYLQALSEAGMLRELDRPPSKLYQLANPETHWSLHQRVHRALRDTERSEEERVRIALAVLQTLLGRPIFQAELLHAGFTALPDTLEKVVVGDTTRRTYRDLFSRRASPRIDVPSRDPLFAFPAGDPILDSAPVVETIRRILVKSTGVDHLVAERPAGPAQAQLSLGGNA